MRMKFLLAGLAGFALMTPVVHADTLHNDWENYKAGRALKRLSGEGQKTLTDVFQIQALLNQGKTSEALPLLADAQKNLQAAGLSEKKFLADEKQLTAASGHVAAPAHKSTTGTVTWIPVGGQFVVDDTLVPEKQQAVKSANDKLKAGQTDQAAQVFQVVGQDSDLMIALAPLNDTLASLHRAEVFAEAKQSKEALDAISDILNGIIFISDNVFITAAPPPGAAAPAAAAPVKK
ncbi:hypothetical protein HK11_08185 [Acetobacter sp. DmW_043]|uniref:YfdX family protein n=1 Tax=Acetobacter TaxID=434 RepID=UPI000A37724A|nr:MULTISPECIES: YfdX family protein [Acetobacter]MBS0959326.1 YfdX family protein [Acetobacter thailandicus]OUI87962.1 hypothetical protein HK11_08185 [Acetobacter sp. DmW_043]